MGFNGSYSGKNTSPTKFYLSDVDCGAATSGSGGSGGTAGTTGTAGTAGTSSGGTAGTGGSTNSCTYPQWQQGKQYSTGNIVTYITEPWGTRIEIIERAPLQPTQ